MVRVLVAICVLMGQIGLAQRPFTEVRVSPSQVYVGQPAQVVVSVYTPTWFTQGVKSQNISVEGAFTVYFRSVSTSKTIKGQTYAGVSFYYHVIPFKQGVINFPSLQLRIQTPKVGDYKGVDQTIKSRERSIQVNSPPVGLNTDQWVVASGQQVYQSWQMPKDPIAVGQVITRTVKRTINNNVSELIPPFQWDSISGVRMYPKTAQTINNKTKTSISGTSEQTMQYLLVDTGWLEFPKMEFAYYNPVYKRTYKRVLPAKKVYVLPSENQGVVSAMIDSLQVQQVADTPVDSPPWYKTMWPFVGKVLGGVLVFSLLIWALATVGKFGQKKYKAYLQSERYAFYQFLRSLNSNNSEPNVNRAYVWWNKLGTEQLTLSEFIQLYGTEQLVTANKGYLVGTTQVLNGQARYWKEARKKWMNQSVAPSEKLTLNP